MSTARIGFGSLLYVSLLITSLYASASAQPAWVKEAASKAAQITVHPDAQALYLYDERYMRVGKGGRVDSHFRTAVKILKSTGVSYGSFSELINPYREVQGLEGWLIDSDGKTKALKKEYVIKQATSTAAGYYDDNMVMSAGFPEVTAGAIVAWEYTVTDTDPWAAVYGGFVFQSQEPVVTARFIMELPDGSGFHVFKRLMDSAVYIAQGNHHEWTMTNLPYRKTEPFMPGWRLLSRRIIVSCYSSGGGIADFADWPAVSRFVANIQDTVTAPDDAIAEFVRQHFTSLPSAADRLAAIAGFVRDNIRYVAVEIGKGRQVPRAPASTLSNRYGDCKDKVALMRCMLRQVGIPSISVFAAVNTWVSPVLPTPFQFDHVIIAIPEGALGAQAYPDATVNGWVFFDPTDETTPLGAISPTLSDTWVLLGTPVDSPLVKLPPLEPAKYQRHFVAEAELTPSGGLTAQLRVTDYGALASSTIHNWRTTEVAAQLEDWSNYFAGGLVQPAIAEYATHQDKDSAWMTCRLEAPGVLQVSGEFSLLKIDFFHDDVTGVFKSKTREHPIRFGAPMRVVTDVSWHLPDTWVLEGIVDSMSASCPGCSYTCQTRPSEAGLTFHSIHDRDGRILESSEYPAAQAFRKEFEKAQGLRIVLKKK